VKRSKQQTRLRILDAAFGLFWRQGFLRVSMNEIAARAGITKRALYQHFPSKDDLMAMTLAHSSKLAIERLRAFPRAGEPGAFIDSFFADLSRATGRLASEVEDGLWELVAAGIVTA